MECKRGGEYYWLEFWKIEKCSVQLERARERGDLCRILNKSLDFFFSRATTTAELARGGETNRQEGTMLHVENCLIMVVVWVNTVRKKVTKKNAR